jgi:hypothetical protein
MIPVAIAAASKVAKSKAREVKTRAAFMAAALVTGGASLLFLTLAATKALSDAIGFVGASCIMAAVFAFLTLCILMLRSAAIMRSKQSKPSDPIASTVTKVIDSSSVSPATLSLMALAAGFFLAKKK